MRHPFQTAAAAIITIEAATGEKFTLDPCPHCRHTAQLWEPVKDPDSWGGYQWSIGCTSSHCRAEVRTVADGWFDQVDMNLNPGWPHNGYRDRVTDLRDRWNRRA